MDKDEKEIREYKVENLRFKPRKKKGKGRDKQAQDTPDAELKHLEALEKKEASQSWMIIKTEVVQWNIPGARQVL